MSHVARMKILPLPLKEHVGRVGRQGEMKARRQRGRHGDGEAGSSTVRQGGRHRWRKGDRDGGR